MNRNRLIVATLGILFLALVGYGYVATRQNSQPSPTPFPYVVSPTPNSVTTMVSPAVSVSPQPSKGSQATVNQVKIVFIALNNGGNVGCGDSTQQVIRTLAPTTAPLKAAMQELLAQKSQYYGQSGLYNALYQSNLSVQDASINNGVATINLSGTLQLGGTCDSPRVQAQLEQTALQFSTVTKANIFINGKPLAEALSQK